jgi:hypothetical protein
MRRLSLLVIAVLLAATVIVGATLVERPSPNPIPGEIAQLISALGTPEGQLLEPVAVPFPPAAGTIVSHAFFPLTGGHNQLDCLACHVSGVYQGTDPTGYTCHAEDDPHQGANGTVCSTCHIAESWQAVSFDHSTIGTRDCADCHEAPPEHFAPPCAVCHVSTEDFTAVLFDHSQLGTQDCVDCHQPPPDHFPAPCATCHIDTTQFLVVSFDHSLIGSQDCSACHTPPPNHFPAPCATCHVSTANFQVINFDHSLIGSQDCAACHTSPANHFPAPCAACHVNTTNFQDVSFDHSFIGGQDCASCHQPPPNHFPGACSSCHQDTTNFRNATFNHLFPLNHGEANGQCATCHANNNTSTYTCTACHRGDELREEHEKEDIFDFSNCVACHADGKKPDD